MASLAFYLLLFCLHILMPPAESTAPVVRALDVHETYVVSEGAEEPQSHLFSQCMADARTVEGVLYSIEVADDEEYVRFVPEEALEFEWTAVDLGGDAGIIDCAQKAFDLSAYMFKFDVSCSVALTSSYDPRSEQSCDEAVTEVVYITSRPFNIFNGEIVPFGESRDCYYSSPEGMRYGADGLLVHEVTMPALEICSPTANQGYHLVLNCTDMGMNFCEAEDRCKAMGLPMASKTFFDELATIQTWRDDKTFYWVNLRYVEDAWLWIPEMEEVPVVDISNADYGIYYHASIVYPSAGQIELHAYDAVFKHSCVFCHDPNSALPPC